MNEYIVTVEYWPIVVGKEKTIRVKTDKTAEEIYDIILEKENQKNPYFDVILTIQTLEEYLSDIKVIEL